MCCNIVVLRIVMWEFLELACFCSKLTKTCCQQIKKRIKTLEIFESRNWKFERENLDIIKNLSLWWYEMFWSPISISTWIFCIAILLETLDSEDQCKKYHTIYYGIIKIDGCSIVVVFESNPTSWRGIFSTKKYWKKFSIETENRHI